MTTTTDRDLELLQEADRWMSTEEPLTAKQKIEQIAHDQGINITDWYGKYLIFQVLLNHMPKDEADQFMADTITMIDDEYIDAAYEVL